MDDCCFNFFIMSFLDLLGHVNITYDASAIDLCANIDIYLEQIKLYSYKITLTILPEHSWSRWLLPNLLVSVGLVVLKA